MPRESYALVQQRRGSSGGGYGALTVTAGGDGGFGDDGVITPITNGCKPTTITVAIPVAIATPTADAQADTVHRG